ncbi:hypothetical protein D3C71_1976070 [compost metagenome]
MLELQDLVLDVPAVARMQIGHAVDPRCVTNNAVIEELLPSGRLREIAGANPAVDLSVLSHLFEGLKVFPEDRVILVHRGDPSGGLIEDCTHQRTPAGRMSRAML